VEDVVPFCYGTVAWFIGKKARARARQRLKCWKRLTQGFSRKR
jgi:hypothetical protein